MIFMERSEGRRPLGRPACRWEDNIKWILKTWDGEMDMDCIDLPQDMDRWRAVVIAVMNLRFPQNARNFLTSCGTVSFSGMAVMCSAVLRCAVLCCALLLAVSLVKSDINLSHPASKPHLSVSAGFAIKFEHRR